MQAVLISITEPWCRMIAEGRKTMELRKTIPNRAECQWDKPFKVYVYCTKTRRGKWLDERTGNRLDGHVIGEFTCTGIYYARKYEGRVPITYNKILRAACVTEQELDAYSKGNPVYGWEISGFRMYDIPLPLSAFGVDRAPQSWIYVEDRDNVTV